MPQTYRGITQRTNNGRFLYGRTGNYRLNPCLMSLVNQTLTIASQTPTTGAAPLSVTSDVAAETPGSLTPGISTNWPTTGNGMSSGNNAGGIAVQNNGYARINSPPAITVLKTWDWGDATPDTNVAFGSSTVHAYAAGTYVPTFIGKDALARQTVQTLPTITAS